MWDENGRGDWRVCGKDRRPNPHPICATPYHSAQPFAVAIVGGPWLKYSPDTHLLEGGPGCGGLGHRAGARGVE